jgi:hypothetical protein
MRCGNQVHKGPLSLSIERVPWSRSATHRLPLAGLPAHPSTPSFTDGVAPAGLDRGCVLLPEYLEDYISDENPGEGPRGMGGPGIFLGWFPRQRDVRPIIRVIEECFDARSASAVWRTGCATSRPRPRPICSRSSRRGSRSIRQPGGSSQTPARHAVRESGSRGCIGRNMALSCNECQRPLFTSGLRPEPNVSASRLRPASQVKPGAKPMKFRLLQRPRRHPPHRR